MRRGPLNLATTPEPCEEIGAEPAGHVDDRVLDKPTADYRITLGGTLDSFNSASYVTTNNDKTMREVPLYQPDRFLRLANVGTTDIVNPRVVVNGRRSWHSADDVLAGTLRPGMSDREKAFALFGLFSGIDVQAHNNDLRVDEIMPDLDAAPGFNTFRERADPIKAVNIYYPSGCILSAANLVIMARHAGLRARLLAAAPLDGPYDQHGGAEIAYDGAWHYFDPEARTFFLCRDNKTVASYEQIHRDPGLVLRTHAHGFAAQECRAAFIMLYRAHYPPYEVPVEQWTHRLNLRLRPREELIYRWQDRGKYRYGNNRRDRPGRPYRLANGLLVYQPRLDDPNYRDGIVHEVNTTMSGQGATPGVLHQVLPNHPASVMWKVESPYPIVGGRVSGRFVMRAAGRCWVSVCTGPSWHQVWEGRGAGVLDAVVDIDPVLAALTSPAVYSYYVRFGFGSEEQPSAAGLEAVRLESDLQMSQAALPALSVGRNVVSVRTDNKEDAAEELRLRVTHGWDESTASASPPAPRRAFSPTDGALVEAVSLRELTWSNGSPNEIVDHHVVVSTRPDFLIPVAPNFDRLTFTAASRWKVPRSFLRAGTTYYWRVRSRNGQGIWSAWSHTWTFTVVKPRESHDD